MSPAHTEQVYQTTSMQAMRRRAVVLDAIDVAYSIHRAARAFHLMVAPDDAERARLELAEYDRENEEIIIKATPLPHHDGAWIGACVYVIVIVTVAGLTQWNAFGIDWRDAGRTQAGLIRSGELWRCVTALTLHADPAHLLGNIVFGCIFGWFAGQLVGPGLAWLGIVTAGGMGNLLNALIRPETHSSLGASTAVFAALGLVAAFTWSARRHSPTSAFIRWAPLVVAVVLLGYLGASGERTDVAAHITGALSGTVLGAVFERRYTSLVLTRRGQALLGVASLALVAAAWVAAIRVS